MFDFDHDGNIMSTNIIPILFHDVNHLYYSCRFRERKHLVSQRVIQISNEINTQSSNKCYCVVCIPNNGSIFFTFFFLSPYQTQSCEIYQGSKVISRFLLCTCNFKVLFYTYLLENKDR